MARPKEFSPDEALDKAMGLFWKKGYFDTSMRDLVAETGVSHAGLYGTFGNKHELFLSALDLYYKQVKGEVMSRLEAPNAGLAEVEAYFEATLAMASDPRFENGCMICNAAVDLAPEDPEVLRRVQGYLERMIAGFRSAVENAKGEGVLRADLDAEAAADVLGSAQVAMGVFLRSGMNAERIAAFSKNVLAVLK